MTDKTPITLGEALAKFECRPLNPTTKETYLKSLHPMVEFLGADTPLSDVTTEMLEAWHAELMASRDRYAGHSMRKPYQGKLSDHTIYRHLKTARVFFKWLVRRRVLAFSPTDAMTIRKPPKTHASLKAAPMSTLAAIMRVARSNPRDWAMLLFLIDTGCRSGGLRALRKKDLRLDEMVAWVTEKGEGPRKVIFSKVTAEALRAWLKVRPNVPSQIVFPSRQTKDMLTDAGLRRRIYELCDKAGVPRTYPHAIRHANGNRLAINGMPLSLIQKHLGHKNSSMTAEFYMPDGEDEWRLAIRKWGVLNTLLGDMSIDEFIEKMEEAAAKQKPEDGDEAGSMAVIVR